MACWLPIFSLIFFLYATDAQTATGPGPQVPYSSNGFPYSSSGFSGQMGRPSSGSSGYSNGFPYSSNGFSGQMGSPSFGSGSFGSGFGSSGYPSGYTSSSSNHQNGCGCNESPITSRAVNVDGYSGLVSQSQETFCPQYFTSYPTRGQRQSSSGSNNNNNFYPNTNGMNNGGPQNGMGFGGQNGMNFGGYPSSSSSYGNPSSTYNSAYPGSYTGTQGSPMYASPNFGCQCNSGYYRNPMNGKCVASWECPTNYYNYNN